jgi:hypothetical protein
MTEETKAPGAIAKRHRLVQLDDGKAVLVERWSLAKMLYAFEYLASVFKEVADQELAQLSGNPYTVALKLVQLLGDRAHELLRLCVAKDDQDKVTPEIAPEDAVEIVAACVELNLTEKLLKKVEELRAKFAPKSAGAK